MAYIKKIWKDYPDATTPINAEDLNNIENGIEAVDTVVNNGWIPLTGTFTYSSADSPTFVMTTSVDLTGIVGLGMRIKLTQTTTKYFIVTAITNDSITMYGGTDYSLNNSAISNSYYSMLKTPYGFPTDPNKWSIITTINTDEVQNNPVNGTWYNVGSKQINIPIGLWKVSVGSTYVAVRSSTAITDNWVKSTLSTTNNTESDTGFTKAIYCQTPSTTTVTAFGATYVEKILNLSASAIYYFNLSTIRDNNAVIRINGPVSATTIKAVCGYL